MSKITILGLDPGLSFTGYAIAEVDVSTKSIVRVADIGCAETARDNHRTIRKTSDDFRRARAQAEKIQQLVDLHQVSIVAAEMVTTTPYKLPTFSFGVMVGIIASLDKPVIEVLPREVKKVATGDDRATKRDMIAWALKKTARQKLPWPTSSRQNKLDLTYRGKHVTLAAEHPADALAIIEAAIATQQFHLGHILMPENVVQKVAG